MIHSVISVVVTHVQEEIPLLEILPFGEQPRQFDPPVVTAILQVPQFPLLEIHVALPEMDIEQPEQISRFINRPDFQSRLQGAINQMILDISGGQVSSLPIQ